jgi:flagellin
MLAIQEYDSTLDPVYGVFTARIKGLVASMYLRNAAEYTGMSAADAYVRSALAENMANTDSINTGIALVETNLGYLETIGQKLDKIKKLADDAATGGFSSAEVADMQGQLEALAEEIDDIAQGPLGEKHLLSADGLMEKVFIGSGIYLDIQTHDMDTSSGLGLGGVDLTADPGSAVAKIQAAITEAGDYSTYLDGRHDSLQAAASSLEVQRSSLLAVESAIESTDAALMIVGLIDARAHATTDILVIAQANAAAQMVLNLLAD